MVTNLWFIAVALGPVLLGGAIIFAITRRRQRSAQEQHARKQANRELYERPNTR